MSILKVGMYASQFPVGYGDPHWDKVVVLLHFDGDLTDETGKIWTGGVESKFTEEGRFLGAVNFTGNHNERILAPVSEDFEFGAEDFTIEFFSMCRSLSGGGRWPSPISKRLSSTNKTFDFLIPTDSSLWSFGFSTSTGSNFRLSDSQPVVVGTIYHIAATRSGGYLSLFVNGVEVAKSGDIGDIPLQSTSARLNLGMLDNGSVNNRHAWNGWVDELRITKGVARYTENFTPPTKPFPRRGPA